MVSALITHVNKKKDIILEEIFSIYYLILFEKNKVRALINFCNKVNTMLLKHALKLGSKIRSINIKG